MWNDYCILQIRRIFEKYCLPIEMITVYKCYYGGKPRLPVLKSFQAIINLVFECYNTIESPLRILYFTPNFTDMLLYATGGQAFSRHHQTLEDGEDRQRSVWS